MKFKNNLSDSWHFQNSILVSLLLINCFNIAFTQSNYDDEDDFVPWSCDNGDIIDSDNKCDGKMHCRDGSDEIAENCIHMICPGLGFRCAYGACVAGNHKCNNIENCADGSDEMPLLCSSEKDSIYNRLQGNCTDDDFQMQCKSGECIDRSNICDGHFDCRDGSDETAKLCSAVDCPNYAFQCGYGACVEGRSKCDGVKNCPDGSDEAWELCGTIRKAPMKTITTTTTTPTPPIGGCNIPIDRQNLLVIVQNTAKRNYLRGDIVPYNYLGEFSCSKGFYLIGDSQAAVCSANGWGSPLPYCTKLCSVDYLKRGASTVATCFNQNKETKPCEEIMPGWSARIDCAEGFDRLRGGESQTLTCQENGEWSNLKYPCQQVCGVVASQVVEYTKGGEPVNITKIPWHVGIYQKTSDHNYTQICGGTIISPHLILTAAHCFFNKATNAIDAAEVFAVVAGKTFRAYYKDESLGETSSVQRLTLSRIVTENYTGDELYRNDLAIVVLDKPLRYGKSVRPICLQFLQNAAKEVRDNIVGEMAGWGSSGDANEDPEMLRRVTMTTKSHAKCLEFLRETNSDVVLANDKFCVASDHLETACRGDSGGGFVRKYYDQLHEKPTYYYLGLVSNAPSTSQQCSRDSVVAMTNYQYFEHIIRKQITETDLYREGFVTLNN